MIFFAAESNNEIDLAYYKLNRMLESGPIYKTFLWPLDLTEIKDNSFGCLIDYISTEFISLNELQNITCKLDSIILVEACLKIVFSFYRMNLLGVCFQSIDPAKILINPLYGDVIICNIDNVVCYGEITNLYDMPQYMAPDIIMEEAYPNTYTDRFSLSALLFLILCMGHPFEGNNWVVPCITPTIEKNIYGYKAVFIFDPRDASNRPVKGIHNNVVKRWELLPSYLQDIFIEAFSRKSITNVNYRVGYLRWMKALARFRNDIVLCTHCGNEIIISDDSAIFCDKCKGLYEKKNTIKFHDYSIPITKKVE